MKIVSEVNLVKIPVSECTESPIIKLKHAIKNLNSGEAVKVTTSYSITSKRFLEKLADKEGLRLQILYENEEVIVLLVKL